MIEVIQSDTFQQWLHHLRDPRAFERIDARLTQVERGNFGDTTSVGDGVSEMRVHYGPGYRLYYIRRGARVIVLLCRGDKDTQSRDIRRAKRLATYWRQDNA